MSERRPGRGLFSGEYRAVGPGYVDPRRPGLSWIRLVCEPELRMKLIDRAADADVSLSEVVRRACRAYLGLPE